MRISDWSSDVCSSDLRRSSVGAGPRAKEAVNVPHKFAFRSNRDEVALVIPRVSSENRPFLPVGLVERDIILGDRNFAIYDAPLWNLALIASRLHWVWIGTVRSEEHKYELQSIMRTSYAVFCLKKNNIKTLKQ